MTPQLYIAYSINFLLFIAEIIITIELQNFQQVEGGPAPPGMYVLVIFLSTIYQNTFLELQNLPPHPLNHPDDES